MSTSSRDDSGAWTISCDGAQSDKNGRVYALQVLSDGENFASNVQLIDMETDSDRLIYEVDEWITTLWLSQDSKLYLGDANGILHTNETDNWKTIDLGCLGGLTEVWGLDESNMYAVGSNGFIARRINDRWTTFEDELVGNLYSINGCSPNDLYVVGEKGHAYHWNGKRWQTLETGTNLDLHAVLAISPETVYICGSKGILLQGYHERWQFLEGWSEDLYALAWYKDRIYIGGGELGLLVLEDSKPVVVKDNVISYGLVASGEYLCASGDNEVVRYDGKEWLARTYLL